MSTFTRFLCAASLIDICQKIWRENQIRIVAFSPKFLSSVAVKMANCVEIKINEEVMRLRSSTLTVGNLAMISKLDTDQGIFN